jgi:hypothetical protein
MFGSFQLALGCFQFTKYRTYCSLPSISFVHDNLSAFASTSAKTPFVSFRICRHPVLHVPLNCNTNCLIQNNLLFMSKHTHDIYLIQLCIKCNNPLFPVHVQRHSLAIFLSCSRHQRATKYVLTAYYLICYL